MYRVPCDIVWLVRKGGFAWSATSQNYKNCVTSQLGVLAAAKLARLLGDQGRASEPCACKARRPLPMHLSFAAAVVGVVCWWQRAACVRESV